MNKCIIFLILKNSDSKGIFGTKVLLIKIPFYLNCVYDPKPFFVRKDNLLPEPCSVVVLEICNAESQEKQWGQSIDNGIFSPSLLKQLLIMKAVSCR